MRPWNASLFVLTCLGAGVGIPIPLDGLGSSTVGRRAVICETTDLEAEPLVDSLVVDEDMLECEYGSNSSFTFCTYGIGNSSLTQGPPSCPPFLALEQNPANPVSRTALDPVSSGDGRNGPSSTFHTSSTVFSSQISSSGGSSGAGRGGQSTPSFTGSAQQTYVILLQSLTPHSYGSNHTELLLRRSRIYTGPRFRPEPKLGLSSRCSCLC
ncbi:hypothetical protein K438DRAFT_1040256 [Mycena galopus ATCC 62051]|nr:hypothetical protein K438DRAFT_1040256 [Mycena galopus ATCC 62051]